MSKAQDAVREATFWDLAICLDCLETQDRELRGGDVSCEACGSVDVVPAVFVQRISVFLADDEGDA